MPHNISRPAGADTRLVLTRWCGFCRPSAAVATHMLQSGRSGTPGGALALGRSLAAGRRSLCRGRARRRAHRRRRRPTVVGVHRLSGASGAHEGGNRRCPTLCRHLHPRRTPDLSHHDPHPAGGRGRYCPRADALFHHHCRL